MPALAAAAVTAAVSAAWPAETAAFLRLEHLGDKVARPMIRALGFMGLGLAAAMAVEALGWTVALGRLAAPLTNLARLPRVAGASFTIALVSNPAANALLSEAWEKKELTPRALTVANLLNGSWPSFIVHLPSTLAVAVSFAGRAGLAYAAIMFAAATVRLIGAAALGRCILPPVEAAPPEPGPAVKKTLKEIWPGLRQRLVRRLTALLSMAVPVFFLVTLAANLGFFAWLRDVSAAHLPGFFLPVEAAALVVFSLAAEFTSGFVAAGALLHNATLTVAEAAAALVLGNIMATPVRVLRWQLAAFLGYFQVKQGLWLIGCNQAFRVASLALSLFMFWQIFGS